MKVESRKKSVPYSEVLTQLLQDSEEAEAYLNAAFEDEDPQVFLLALKDVADAHGGMSKLAKVAGLNRESLYKALSVKGNPGLKTLEKVLHALGFKLAVAAA